VILAKNNIIVKIHNSSKPEYAILNPVSGSFDLMDETEYNFIQKISEGENPDNDFSSYLLERGYAYNNFEDENTSINKAYSEFNDEISQSEVQLMLVPTYGCNLACTYCYQGNGTEQSDESKGTDSTLPIVNMSSKPTMISKDTVDAFFDYARINFPKSTHKPFLTLFGGEPLANSPVQRKIIEYIIDKCAEENYELSAVTNGYDFIEYVDILKKAKIKEIQFTLDGSKDVHDKRRATANKKGTFDRIIAGIEAAVHNKMPVNLRSVVDMENIKDIVNLAEFLDKKGWLDLPPELFKTQMGRNYELFDCYAKPQHLMTQAELWGEFASLSKTYPVLSKLHRPDFKGIRHLVDTGELYMASFDTCPACKSEWVFDLYGNIYGCTASCGREEYLLGTFWPEVNLNTDLINTWKSRDVKSIPECKNCKYDVICGGGCGVVASNQNCGNILSPDCRPIQDLVEIGINYYIDDIKAMSDGSAQQEDIAAQNTGNSSSYGAEEDIVVEKMCCGCELDESEEDTSEDNCCSTVTETASENYMYEKKPIKSSTKKETNGCIICGQDLIYSKDLSTKETCNICGQKFEAYVRCSKGHYVCDQCHSLDILGKTEQLLYSSDENNPLVLSKMIFELPGLNMHGNEYHSIVPAALVTAWQNLNGKKDISKIKEAIKRGKDIKGGSCGLYGSCGACVGTGIAVSIIEGVTPMSKNERGAANRVTGHALLEISKYGGPRCCKREAITSIESFMQVTGYFDSLSKVKYSCKQYGSNKDCIRQKCPYFPVEN